MQLLMNRHSKQDEAPAAPEPDPAAVEAAKAAAEQQRVNAEAANLLQESNTLEASLNGEPSGTSAEPDATSALDSLLDSGQPSNASTAAISDLLGDSAPADPANANLTAEISGLLSDSASPSPVDNDGAGQPAAIASLAAIDATETLEAQSFGSDWSSGFGNLKDAALETLRNQVQSPTSVIANLLGDSDPLKDGATAAIRSFLPESSESAITLGSIVQDKFVDVASDKLADTLTNTKDELACSGQDTAVENSACMVLMAPTNLGRGLYAYGQVLVERVQKMAEDMAQYFFPTEVQ